MVFNHSSSSFSICSNVFGFVVSLHGSDMLALWSGWQLVAVGKLFIIYNSSPLRVFRCHRTHLLHGLFLLNFSIVMWIAANQLPNASYTIIANKNIHDIKHIKYIRMYVQLIYWFARAKNFKNIILTQFYQGRNFVICETCIDDNTCRRTQATRTQQSQNSEWHLL